MGNRMNKRMGGLLLLAGIVGLSAPLAAAAEDPSSGGILRIATRDEPSSYDCHAATSIAALQYLVPHYSTLLKFDQSDFPTIIGDLAQDWSVSDDLRTYSFVLRDNVTFHDGTTFDAEDVRASFERMANPPEGVVSARATAFDTLESIEVSGPHDISFHLSEPSSGFLSVLASPWNCIYSAEKLAEDPVFPATNIMGTGPFVFDVHEAGARWAGTRFDDYFHEGRPYLDGFEMIIVSGAAATNAIASGQVDAIMRLISVPDEERIRDARGEEVVFQVTPATSVTLPVINTTRAPFDDVRVRRALSLAIDRDVGVEVLGDIAGQRYAHIIFREGHALAPDAEEIRRFTGFSGYIEAQRAEARRLLEEAGQTGLSFTLLNRNLPVPYQPVGIFLIDQWRQIGVNVDMIELDTAGWSSRLRALDYDVAIDLNAPSSDDPTDVLRKYVPGSTMNTTGIEDERLVELFIRQDQTMDEEERAALVREFVDRVIELQFVLPTFNAERRVALDRRMRGWTVPPSFNVGLDLSDIWLAEE